MNNLVKILTFYLFIASHTLCAASLNNKTISRSPKKSYENEQDLLIRGYCRRYGIPHKAYLDIIAFKYDKHNKVFSGDDIAGKNLENYDLSKWTFRNTDLTNTKLHGVVLTDTIFEYQLPQINGTNQTFTVPRHVLSAMFSKMKKIYDQLEYDVYKAVLLSVASGLYYSIRPYQEKSIEYNIIITYWYCALRNFCNDLQDKRLSKDIEQGIFAVLYFGIKGELAFCWKREKNDQKSLTDIDDENPPHQDFNKYLSVFNQKVLSECKGSVSLQYNAFNSVEERWPIADNYYVRTIQKCIQGLGKAYFHIKNEECQQESVKIAYALSTTPERKEGWDFLIYYFFYQYRLLKLNEKVGEKAKPHIHYDGIKDLFL